MSETETERQRERERQSVASERVSRAKECGDVETECVGRVARGRETERLGNNGREREREREKREKRERKREREREIDFRQLTFVVTGADVRVERSSEVGPSSVLSTKHKQKSTVCPIKYNMCPTFNNLLKRV